MRSFVFIMVMILVGLQYKLWAGHDGIAHWHALQKQLIVQEEKNKKLAGTNQALDADIMGLKSGDQALEEQARFELGMVKEGEVYYQFIDG